ncbi:MAG: carbohydrate kinase family protein [Blautia sp.]|nr:carbohydrate kinase family protein [Blautia sp.]
MSKLIAAGHVCIDITPVFPSHHTYRELGELLEPGKLIHMEGADVHTGGSVANTGLALKLLGNDVQLLGKIGDDALGWTVQRILSSYGVDGLIVDKEGKTSYSVVLAVPGIDRIFLHDPGANDTFVSEDIPDSVFEGAQLFHFGYPPLMKAMMEEDGAELVKLFSRAKEHGLATSLDFAAIDPNSPAGHADWTGILRKVLPFVDFFEPSFEELCFMLDREKYDRLSQKGKDMTDDLDVGKDVLPLADPLLHMGCGVVLIKCGTSGMVCKTADQKRIEKAGLGLDTRAWADYTGIQPCFKADIVRSATGAGDTSIAAFLTAVLTGRIPADCLAMAAAEGACCVTAYDALSGLCPLSVLEERIRAGWATNGKEEKNACNDE